MSQSQVRQKFVRRYPGVRLNGYPGLWYRCNHCGRWCGRPGPERAYIPPELRMEVDHIRPWSQGGSDELWNLQPLCRTCNRSKSNNASYGDNMRMVKNDIMHGDFVGATVKRAFRQNKVLKKLGINKRK